MMSERSMFGSMLAFFGVLLFAIFRLQRVDRKVEFPEQENRAIRWDSA